LSVSTTDGQVGAEHHGVEDQQRDGPVRQERHGPLTPGAPGQPPVDEPRRQPGQQQGRGDEGVDDVAQQADGGEVARAELAQRPLGDHHERQDAGDPEPQPSRVDGLPGPPVASTQPPISAAATTHTPRNGV
jgi:hypothetical protein